MGLLVEEGRIPIVMTPVDNVAAPVEFRKRVFEFVVGTLVL